MAALNGGSAFKKLFQFLCVKAASIVVNIDYKRLFFCSNNYLNGRCGNGDSRCVYAKTMFDGIFHQGLQNGFYNQMLAERWGQMIRKTDGLAEPLVHQTHIGIGMANLIGERNQIRAVRKADPKVFCQY